MDKMQFAVECIHAQIPIQEAKLWWEWASSSPTDNSDVLGMNTYEFLYDPAGKQQATFAANAMRKVAPTVGDLIKMGSQDILRVPRIGKNGLAYIVEKLNKYNLTLGQ